MLRFLRLLAQILVLVIVALASTLISMRYAIHGREVSIPDFRGLSSSEADRLAFDNGLELSQSDRFYSATVPAGRLLSQQPPPGSRVRRGWRVQSAVSLGPQLIEIPSVAGLSPRAAEINLRRRGLELGPTAELPTSTAAPQTILAQTPAAGAQGVASPSVSLLYAAAPPESAYAMPDLSGLTLSEATSLITASGLKVLSASTVSTPAATAANAGQLASTPSHPSAPRGTTASHSPATSPSSLVVGQTPAPGTRVTAATNVSLQLARS